ncbi:uncharacterized protein KY384_002353 [Bacidia gigantensis]|uniref:uncharacterized protein n=1 Tax=Bacidia gigantensis TaxID=2732470 RepID=UPI001D0375DA|nr:uncharacterized protein KY384_002353 [Bacidia gigantensis]KAG8532476.1 hypothetical protein KY384_002353 [Bacidia gigantensis]
MGEPNMQMDSVGSEDTGSEYGYDEHETETFYVTVDLSSAAPLRARNKPHKAAPAKSQEPPNTVNDESAGALSQDEAQEPQTRPESSKSTSRAPKTNLRANQIQILDLHTTNPMISYQNQLYTCSWGTALGTDIILAPKYPSPETPITRPLADAHDPTRPEATVLATTNIRLSGRPIEAIPRPEAPSAPTPLPTSLPASTISLPHQPTLPPANHTSTVKHLDPGPNASKARTNQAAFLERIMKSKQGKGETDRVITSLPAPNRKFDDEGNLIRGRGGRKGRPRRRGSGRGGSGGRGRGRGRGGGGGSWWGRALAGDGKGEAAVTPKAWEELEGGDERTREDENLEPKGSDGMEDSIADVAEEERDGQDADTSAGLDGNDVDMTDV